MKHLSSAVKVGILFAILAVGSYGVWKTIGQRPSGKAAYQVWAKLGDAAGLPLGSQVVIAGLPVGEVDELSIEGRYAKVTMNLRDDVVLYENAILFKKSSSLLGNFYLEIDPGTPATQLASGELVENERIPPGGEIVRVVEATSVDALIRRIDETMPKVDAVLVSVRDLSEDVRRIVNGPLDSMVTRLDRLVEDEADTVSQILARTDRTIARIEDITRDIRSVTQGADAKVDSILANLDQAAADARELVAVARTEVEQTGEAVRSKIDSVDQVIDPTASVMRKIDEDQGTLGRLVNDSTIADNVEEITEDAKGFLGTLFGMQTYVGLRSEYNVRAGLARHYISLELQTRPDKFYYIELEKGPRGAYPGTELVWDHDIGAFRRDVTIEDKVRFTFQFAKRIDWLTLRYGLKESTGGVGADAVWFDRRLKLSVDLFDASFDQLPRLKVAAAYEFFGFLYVLAGVDEILNPPETLPIEPLETDVPIQFETFQYGRDYFVGAALRFNDRDLAALMTVGGAALAGAVD